MAGLMFRAWSTWQGCLPLWTRVHSQTFGRLESFWPAGFRVTTCVPSASACQLPTTPSGSGEVSSCRSMVYVSSSVQAMYLSYDSLLNLGLWPKDFPSGYIGKGLGDERGPDIPHMPGHSLSVSAIRSTSGGCTDQNHRHGSQCSCPQRTVPPARPATLPFPCTPENNS